MKDHSTLIAIVGLFTVVVGLVGTFILLMGYAPHPIYSGNYINGVVQISRLDPTIISCASGGNEYLCCYLRILYTLVVDGNGIQYDTHRDAFQYQFLPSSPVKCTITPEMTTAYPIGTKIDVYYDRSDILFNAEVTYVRSTFIAGMVLMSTVAISFILCVLILIYQFHKRYTKI